MNWIGVFKKKKDAIIHVPLGVGMVPPVWWLTHWCVTPVTDSYLLGFPSAFSTLLILFHLLLWNSIYIHMLIFITSIFVAQIFLLNSRPIYSTTHKVSQIGYSNIATFLELNFTTLEAYSFSSWIYYLKEGHLPPFRWLLPFRFPHSHHHPCNQSISKS